MPNQKYPRQLTEKGIGDRSVADALRSSIGQAQSIHWLRHKTEQFGG